MHIEIYGYIYYDYIVSKQQLFQKLKGEYAMAKQKKRKDGRLQKSFTYNGKRYVVYGHDSEELSQKEHAKREALKENKLNRDNPTMDQFFERWEDNRIDTVKENTNYTQRNRYTLCSNIIIGDKRFGEYRIADITTADIRDLQKALVNTGISNQTTNLRMSFVSKLFKDAIIEGYIDNNPCKPVKALKKSDLSARDTFHRALTQREQEAFFNEAVNSYYYDIFRMAIYTGMRFGELATLYTSDIHDGLIHVERTLTKDDNGRECIGTSTKTKKNRVVPLNEDIIRVINHQAEINRVLDSNVVVNIHDIIFKSVSRGIMSNAVVNNEIARICKKIGIENFTFHCFRDTFATRALENGMNPKTLQEILGHTSFSMTMDLYGHCLTETKKKAMDELKIVL